MVSVRTAPVSLISPCTPGPIWLFSSMQTVIPPPLPPGGTIGIVAPSSGTAPEELEAGLAYLQGKGYRTKVAGNVTTQTHFLAGDRDVRLNALIQMFRDDEVDAVFCARGGDGAIHLLPEVLEPLQGVNPKPFVGYSDITLLQLALYQRFGWVTFSGPMVATELGANTLSGPAEEHFWSMITKPSNEWNINLPTERIPVVWREGTAKGPLLGGCLSLVCALPGTPCLPDFTNAILIIEDTEEPPKSIDRMLHRLRIAGIFGKIGGLVLGQFRNCFPEDPSNDFTLHEIVLNATQGYDFPILANFPYGHNTPDFFTIPIGMTVGLTSTAPHLRFIPGPS